MEEKMVAALWAAGEPRPGWRPAEVIAPFYAPCTGSPADLSAACVLFFHESRFFSRLGLEKGRNGGTIERHVKTPH